MLLKLGEKSKLNHFSFRSIFLSVVSLKEQYMYIYVAETMKDIVRIDKFLREYNFPHCLKLVQQSVWTRQ